MTPFFTHVIVSHSNRNNYFNNNRKTDLNNTFFDSTICPIMGESSLEK